MDDRQQQQLQQQPPQPQKEVLSQDYRTDGDKLVVTTTAKFVAAFNREELQRLHTQITRQMMELKKQRRAIDDQLKILDENLQEVIELMSVYEEKFPPEENPEPAAEG